MCVWGLISSDVEEEDYYSAPAAGGEDHHDDHVVSHYLLNALSCVLVQLISSNGDSIGEDYNYYDGGGEDLDGEDLNYYDDPVVLDSNLSRSLSLTAA